MLSSQHHLLRRTFICYFFFIHGCPELHSSFSVSWAHIYDIFYFYFFSCYYQFFFFPMKATFWTPGLYRCHPLAHALAWELNPPYCGSSELLKLPLPRYAKASRILLRKTEQPKTQPPDFSSKLFVRRIQMALTASLLRKLTLATARNKRL